ncbi:hypothetical protein phytr_6290 [Candidatus Phycorickettsia trachydisci]|uniref:Uncharacterized protein n=1 Tax=Candidatus Phycorickettsia trachydisci TaxID=2115978 RepID=A0A2P1P8G5_9RICK|nr:hypothetical protein [Candidatus Phycorickettsia trachydisci]AVP87570.1 hypothetical protein phytr_6290 [Candidatus Phycorickettsia trachydisci]
MTYRKILLLFIINTAILTKVIFSYNSYKQEVADKTKSLETKPPTTNPKIKVPDKSNTNDIIKFLTSLAKIYTETMKVSKIDFEDKKIILTMGTTNLDNVAEYIKKLETLSDTACDITDVKLSDDTRKDQADTVKKTKAKPAAMPFSFSYITDQMAIKKKDSTNKPVEDQKKFKYTLSITVNL